MTNIYHLTGELATNSGGRTYPVAYTYDYAGRKKTMKTWKNFAAGTGAATTTWNYDEYRGFLKSRVYDDGRGTTNTYTPAGRLRTRTWARGVTTTYHTNAAGEVVATTYSDGTAAVTNSLDRLGRRTNVVDGAGSRFLTYTDSGQLLGETNASGVLSNVSLTYGYDSLLRRTNVSLLTNSSFLLRHSYFFDTTSSRLTNVSDGTCNAGYSYLANSPLISQIAFRSNSTTRMTTTKTYDYLNRLLSISSVGSTGAPPVTADASSAVSFAYSYNDANQRIRRTDPDGSYWLYEYDKLGQLISGKHYWPDHTPVAGQQYEYAYDDIGNRTSTKQGGDASGAGLRPASYTANALNQYTARDVPGAADIIGIAHPSANVTNNGQVAYRKGEYFWSELSVHNTNSAMWTNVTTVAFLTGTNQTNTGNLFLPKTAESFGYDADGNTTNDGRFTYSWDAENRLTQTESLSTSPTASKRKAVWVYDGQGRRVRQTSYDGSSGSYVVSTDLKFVSDGWQCLAELNATNDTRLRSYLWGLDLSGSTTGAGGVGGLLAMTSASSGTHFYAMDGNGNVAGLVSASDGTKTAAQEYDPFGRSLRLTGTAALENPYRFSTKRANDSLDLVSYEYRTYSPISGRWLTRDPIEDLAGEALYAMVNNTIPNEIDRYGLVGYKVDTGGASTLNGPPVLFKCGPCCRGNLQVRAEARPLSDGTAVFSAGASGAWYGILVPRYFEWLRSEGIASLPATK